MYNKLSGATPLELAVWILSGGLFGFGVGATIATRGDIRMIAIILFGLIAHIGATYCIYSKKNP